MVNPGLNVKRGFQKSQALESLTSSIQLRQPRLGKASTCSAAVIPPSPVVVKVG